MSLGTLKDRYDFEPVVRNSIWLTYNVDSKLTFTNKFLIEQGTDTYIRNKTGLDYALSDTLIVGMSNLYVHDLADDNIFTFNIGVKFK